MTVTRASVTTLPADLAERYGLGPLPAPVPLPGEPELVEMGIRLYLVANALTSLTSLAQGRGCNEAWVRALLWELRELE